MSQPTEPKAPAHNGIPIAPTVSANTDAPAPVSEQDAQTARDITDKLRARTMFAGRDAIDKPSRDWLTETIAAALTRVREQGKAEGARSAQEVRPGVFVVNRSESIFVSGCQAQPLPAAPKEE